MPNFETDTKILQSIGHLIQWISDHVLNQISNIRKCPPDIDELRTSRQLLLIIRLWSILLSACSPQFTIKEGKIDVISEAYRLLTETWLRMKEKQEIEPDLVEKCERLKGRVYVEKPMNNNKSHS